MNHTKQKKKALRITLYVIAVIFLIVVIIYFVDYYVGVSVYNNTKKHIPNAKSFIEKHEKSLSLLIDIQNRLDDVEYGIKLRNDGVITIRIFPAHFSKSVTEISIFDFDELEDKEIEAIQDIFCDSEHSSISYVGIRFDNVIIEYAMVEPRRKSIPTIYAHYALLYIINTEINHDYREDYPTSYWEQINELWSIHVDKMTLWI